MIAKVCKNGSNPQRLIDYLAKPQRAGTRLLDTDLVGSGAKVWADQIERVIRAYRPGREKFVKHFVLSYARDEHRPLDEMREAVRYYLARMGYGEAPYIAILHTDTENDHIHVVTTPMSWEGKAASESYDRLRSMRIAAEIEERWNLVRVRGRHDAYVKSPSQEEMKDAARVGEGSARAFFQFEVAQSAKQAHGFVDFLHDLRRKGFEVRVMLDHQGQLKGISFSRDGTSFKGSQLGRGFRAARLLSLYALHYDPATEWAEVLRATAPREGAATKPLGLAEALLREAQAQDRALATPDLPRSERTEALSERVRLKEDQERLAERPEVPGRDLVSLPLPAPLHLPEGRYHLGEVRTTAKTLVSQRVEPEALVSRRIDLSAAEVETIAAEAAAKPGPHLLFVMPITDRGLSVVALRNLTEEQLTRLDRDGVERQAVAKVGDRFDVWLPVPAGVSLAEHHEFRAWLAERYGVPAPHGAFADGIRLPGAPTPHANGPVLVRLIELRDEQAAPDANQRFWARFQQARRDPVAALAQDLSIPAQREPMATAEALLRHEKLPFQPWTRLDEMQSQIERESRKPQRYVPGEAARWPAEKLLTEAQEANREAIHEALEGRRAPHSTWPSRDRLLSLEVEIAGRKEGVRIVFEQARGEFRTAQEALDASVSRVTISASLASIRDYQQAAHAFGLISRDLEALDVSYLRWGLAQWQLDRQRLSAFAYSSGGTAEARARSEQMLGLEVRLAARLGETPPAGFRLDTSAAELRARLARTQASLSRSLRAPGTYPEREELLRERAWLRLLSDRAEARVGIRQAALPSLDELTRRKPAEAWDGAERWRGAHARLGEVEETMARIAVESPEKIRLAADRVAQGDLSPEALRRLNAALLPELPPGRITLPVLPRLEDPQPTLEALSVLFREITARATREAAGESLRPEERARLFSASVEAVLRIAQLDERHRHTLGLSEPSAVPAGLPHQAWDAAWLRVAQQKGLTSAEAASHLAAVGPVPVETRFRLAERLVTFALAEGLRLARGLVRELARELRR